ncbi:MAG: PAC2 family protein [Candidatus Omnitrophota bacterium]
MEGIKIIKRPKLKDPYLIVAWPGMGEVAFKSAHYLVETLKAEECAELLADEFFYPTSSNVKSGVLSLPDLPSGKFYYWKNKSGKNDIVIFMSNAQPDLSGSELYCERILAYAKHIKVKALIGIAAMPQPVEHTQQPNVWVTATSADQINSLKKYELDILADGQISGMNGLFLGIAKREGFQGFCLLGEIPLYTIQIENPKASCAVLEALAKILGIQIDLSSLLTQAHIMEEEINKLMDYLKLGTPLGPIGEEEIEKIKKSLSQLTKLPASVKEKIDGLFNQAKTDISKAGELKRELDKWNVYKEYEDRFLDLFKKKKDNSN